jgi:hypothetical protein
LKEKEEKGIKLPSRCDLGVECKQWFYNYRILNSKKDKKKSAHETPELRQLHRENRRLIVGKKKRKRTLLEVQIQAPLGRKELDRGAVNMIGSVERFILTPVFPHHPLPINKPDHA